ncbi:DUF6511 domain-containing protein [Lysobacter capsici]|uniref:DUF6511 domain-containing protein n=1 Tax=Lysobacter capsici TaxID=435897 RepID=UPI00287B6FA0|nr:DUF6511 domain-containing protein [Lysobacter capsici]WND80396.1 DUF6511 domain-containing protein [Lysobacter capsici]WND85593.1 DUF6511 domain-containing protein [Lysobacter capsici]
MTCCWACGKPARSFGHLDLRRRIGDPRRAPYRWAFCSTACQNAFHQLYDTRSRSDPASIEELLPVTHPLTHDAQRACLKALASVADRIGFDVPLAQYNQAQATQVVDAITQAYESAIREKSSRAGYKVVPPLDGFENDTIPF